MMVDESSDLQRRFYNLVRDCQLVKRNNNTKDTNTNNQNINFNKNINKRKIKDNIQ